MVRGKFSKALLSVCVFTGMVVASMPAEAGTMGNGHMSKPEAKAHYTFCWGAWPRNSTAYFSTIITSAPSTANPSFEAPFRSYLHKTYSIGPSTECFVALSMDDAVAGKKKEETSLADGQKMKIVETDWKAQGVQSQ